MSQGAAGKGRGEIRDEAAVCFRRSDRARQDSMQAGRGSTAALKAHHRSEDQQVGSVSRNNMGRLQMADSKHVGWQHHGCVGAQCCWDHD
jgi:hypothetical protein